MSKRVGRRSTEDPEADVEEPDAADRVSGRGISIQLGGQTDVKGEKSPLPLPVADHEHRDVDGNSPEQSREQTITWATDLKQPSAEKALRVPPPLQRDNGAPLQEIDEITSDDDDPDKTSLANVSTSSGLRRRRSRRLSTAATSMSIERIASSMFVLGETQDGVRSRSREPSSSRHHESANQSSSATPTDRKSSFGNLSKEELGGIEYRSLWLLLKIIIGVYDRLPSESEKID